MNFTIKPLSVITVTAVVQCNDVLQPETNDCKLKRQHFACLALPHWLNSM